jgi:hypothetical protein
MPERVAAPAPDYMGSDNRFEMKQKCSPLFEEIKDQRDVSSVPLMTTMPLAGSDMFSRQATDFARPTMEE